MTIKPAPVSKPPVHIEPRIVSPPRIEPPPVEPVVVKEPPIPEPLVESSDPAPDPDVRYRFDEVDRPPTAISTHLPAFDVKGRKAARGKDLELELLVTPDGRISSVRVVNAIDNEPLQQAAVGAVLRWSFDGGSHRGVPVRVRVPVHLVFYLESGELRAAVTSLGR